MCFVSKHHAATCIAHRSSPLLILPGPVQLALLVVQSWPVFPDMVALGEAFARQRGGQPSVAALVAGPFVPALPGEPEL